MINVAINGFGRIGRRVFRLIQERSDIQIVAINDLADAKTLSHLLKYDSIHGVFNKPISSESGFIIVDGRKISLLNHKHPEDIDWTPFKVDFVIESSGKFKTKSELQYHINNIPFPITAKLYTSPKVLIKSFITKSFPSIGFLFISITQGSLQYVTQSIYEIQKRHT